MHFDQDPLRLARNLMRFVDSSPSPYHAVEQVKGRLLAERFTLLDEREPWSLEPGTRGVVVRGGTLLAFVLGSRPPAEAGFVIVGAHTDSPNLRLKPRPEFESVGYRQLSVEVYGSPILATWLDRDLGLAGRVVLADGSQALVRIEEPALRVPNLAIHLNREVNEEGLALNARKSSDARARPGWAQAARGAGARVSCIGSRRSLGSGAGGRARLRPVPVRLAAESARR
ncbi:MAG: hypothetical protein QM756_28060 [Polyangiaceae bacterium]